MIARVRTLDRSRRTIAVGSVAPGPLMDLSPMLSAEYEDRTISTELCKEEELIPMLKQGIFQLIILRKVPADDEICACPCGSEHLYVSLPESHPLASRKSVSFAEMDGTEFLQISNVGIWEDIKKAEMPHARIYLQPLCLNPQVMTLRRNGSRLQCSGEPDLLLTISGHSSLMIAA